MKKTLTTLWVILISVGVIFPNFYGSIFETMKFGSISYPTSLDTLTNPSATDSVATVSHSAQHANANDAIEAIEAKTGIGASTATLGTVLYGNGTGSSVWSASPSLTTLGLSGLGTFNSFLSLASSTIVGGLTITGNSTTTNATSTIGAFTGYATSTFYYGASLSSCSGAGDKLTWESGSFGCSTDSTGSANFGATSTATTTITASVQLTQTFNLNSGDSLMAWATYHPLDGICNGSSVTFGLYIKPPSSATSTIALAACDQGTSDEVTMPFVGAYYANSTGSHELYIGDASGNYKLVGFASILYQIVEP